MLIEHPERVVWQDHEWRCELWVVNGLRRLRLFRHGIVVRDYAVATAQQALDPGASLAERGARMARRDD